MKNLNIFRILLFATYIFFFSKVHSQENALLYKVSSLKNEHSSYIFGTMHIMSEEAFFFPKAIEEYLLECDALCLEVKEVRKQHVDPNMLFNENKPIIDYFSKSQWDSLINWAEVSLLMNKTNFESNFKFAKPFILIQFLTLSSLPEIHKSHEIELESIAISLGLKLKELESVDKQLKLFDKIPYPPQIKMIMSILEDLDNAHANFNKMQTAYASQNLDSLCSFTDVSVFKPFETELLFKRNLNWIPEMMQMMENEKTFFAVGAGHLCGDHGVLELLKNEGYLIEAIKL
jgi:hypothetical protein